MSQQTQTITYKGIQLEVTFNYQKAYPGKWTLSNGDPGYPDEPEEFYIETICINGVDIYEIISGCDLEGIEKEVRNPEYYSEP